MAGIDAGEAGRGQVMEGLMNHGKIGALSQLSGNYLGIKGDLGIKHGSDKTRIVFKKWRGTDIQKNKGIDLIC